jgi:hypothetical protein
MGILSSRWEAEHDGMQITVNRNELTKGFSLECDGRVLDQKRWSWIGVGELHGVVERDGRSVTIDVELPLSFRRAACTARIDGKPLEIKQVK